MGRKGMMSAALFQTKLALYTSYVIAARVPTGWSAEALYWDTCDPYNYLRVDSGPDHDIAIYGGSDVKTGQETEPAVPGRAFATAVPGRAFVNSRRRGSDDSEYTSAHPSTAFEALEARFTRLCSGAPTLHRWLGQVIETDDGLPFIGENAPRQFIATGFAGNGYTLGTLAAMMARDRYLGRDNAWADLFRVDRKPFHGGIWRYVSENKDFPYHLVRDRLAQADAKDLDAVPNGMGMIVAHRGQKVVAYRADSGELTLLSPVCTHMKCLVRWNAAARTWDCPCHGSRFEPSGAVLSGPAETALQKVQE